MSSAVYIYKTELILLIWDVSINQEYCLNMKMLRYLMFIVGEFMSTGTNRQSGKISIGCVF